MHFALCDATHWMNPYNGFNYEEFYEFVIDFFEADKTPEGKAASTELYDWWNKYVPDFALMFIAINTSLEKCSQGQLLLEQPCPSRHGSRRSRSYEINAKPAYPMHPPSLLEIVTFLVRSTSILSISMIPMI